MRTDTYTKAVLTVIAALLAVIALRPYISPDAVARAQGQFAGLQFADNFLAFLDPRAGEIWEYEHPNGQLLNKYSLTRLGQPLVKEK